MSFIAPFRSRWERGRNVSFTINCLPIMGLGAGRVVCWTNKRNGTMDDIRPSEEQVRRRELADMLARQGCPLQFLIFSGGRGFRISRLMANLVARKPMNRNMTAIQISMPG